MARITQILESLILSGQATFGTWTFGTAGAGTLRQAKDSFMILLDFDYFFFIDEPEPTPEVPATPAKGTFSFIPNDPSGGPFNAVTFVNGTGTGNVLWDRTDVPTTQAAVQVALDVYFPGVYTVEMSWSGFAWSVTITTVATGPAHNGEPITMTTAEPGTIKASVLAGGANLVPAIPTTTQELLDRSVHQLEFRQKGARYSWIIKEGVQILNTDETTLQANVIGHYHKDVYIPFYQDVQIGLIQVPPVADWGVTYQPLDNKSNEDQLPGGYSVTGLPNLNVVYQVLFDNNQEQYLPVTKDRSNATLLQYREQFKVDYATGRELLNPQGAFTNIGAAQRYPIINMSFVTVNMSWNAFKKLQLEKFGL